MENMDSLPDIFVGSPWITVPFSFQLPVLHITRLNLLLVLLIQVLEQNLAELCLATVDADIAAPRSDCGCETSGHIGLLADFGDRDEVRPDCEENCARARQTTSRAVVSKFTHL
jgi:hypothetical protein